MNAAIIGAVAVAAVGIAIFVYSRQSNEEASATADESAELAAAAEANGAAQVTALEPASEAKAAAPLVRVELVVDPANARLELDGEPIATEEGRAIKNVPRDEIRRRLTASAPGYVSASRWIRFDESRAVSLTLVAAPERVVSTASDQTRIRRREAERARLAEKKAAAAAREAALAAKAREEKDEHEDAASAALANKPKAGDSLEAPSRKQTRKIDEHNPYSK